jgi:hypothetical protein
MRTLVRQETEPPALSRDLTAEAALLIDAARTAQRELLALVTALAAGTGDGTLILELADAGARLGENAAGLREVAAALDSAAAGQFCLAAAHAAGLEAGVALAAVPDMPGRHRRGRVSRQRGIGDRPLLNIVRGFAPIGALGAVLKHVWKPALRHHALKAAWAAHPVHVVFGVTAAVAAPVVLVTAAVVTLGHPAALPRTDAAGAVPAPAATAYAAVPITSPLPGAPVVHGGADARTAGQLPEGVPAPWYVAPSSASPSAAATSPPSAGVLSANVTQIDLGAGDGTDPLTGTVVITALNGPASFGAISSDDQELSVSPAEGALSAGQSATLTFIVPAAAQVTGGTATVRVWGGSAAAIAVVVTWEPAPVPSPSSSPSSAATDMDPSPSPDPSSS